MDVQSSKGGGKKRDIQRYIIMERFLPRLLHSGASRSVLCRRAGLASRIVIVDWDVHHGNGAN